MKYYKYIDQGWGNSEALADFGTTEDDYLVRYDEFTGRWYTMWKVFGKNWNEAEWDLIKALQADIKKGTLIEITEAEAFIEIL